MRHTPSNASARPLLLGGTSPSTRRHASPMTIANVLGPYRLAACPTLPSDTPVA